MFNRHVVSVVVAAASALLIWQATASAEDSFTLHSGTALAHSSDLRLTESHGGTGFRIRNSRWDLDAFGGAPYYGFGFTRFFDKHPGWGLAFDFRHYQIYAQPERIWPAGGAWSGIAGNTNVRMDRHVQNFEMSQGVNVLSLNGIYRWANPNFFAGRLQPYVRAGLDYYLPYRGNASDHVLNQAGYDSSGFGFHLQGGVQYRLSRQWGLFAGAKIDSGIARNDSAGSRADTSLRTFRVMGGANYDF